MTSTLSVREEQPGDAVAIGALITAAFAGATQGSGTEAAIVDALRAAGALRLSLVAEADGAIVGQVVFSPVTIDGRHDGWLGLGPVAVAPHRQRAGIGAALIMQALTMLRERRVPGCVLLGDPGYYGRFGFASDPALTYRDIPPPWFQRLALGGVAIRGRVAYHPAFDVSAA